jgi:hypothetical protein
MEKLISGLVKNIDSRKALFVISRIVYFIKVVIEDQDDRKQR